MTKNNELKPTITLSLIAIIFFICFIIIGVKYKSLYAETMKVTDIQYKNNEYTLTLQTGNGNLFQYVTNDGDFEINDYFSVLMDSRYTKTVKDDIIRELKYTRIN